jgi:hydroxyethylthiazole kinase-like uncharacterized protein yjeF
MKTIYWTASHISNLAPKRKENDNKTAGGKCLIIAGSTETPGAAVLTAKAAARVGAGYVYLATNIKSFNILKNPDFLIVDLRSKIDFSKFSAIAIGPGLGQSDLTLRLLKNLIKSNHQNVLVDADAIRLIARHCLYPLPKNWIITPHEGELADILECSASLVRSNRIKHIQKAQKILACNVLLKGKPSLITDGKKIIKILKGNKALAKAGTGDVLSGMITGLMAQGLTTIDAAVFAAQLHGAIADSWVKSSDYLSLMASDLIEKIPSHLLKLRKK